MLFPAEQFPSLHIAPAALLSKTLFVLLSIIKKKFLFPLFGRRHEDCAVTGVGAGAACRLWSVLCSDFPLSPQSVVDLPLWLTAVGVLDSGCQRRWARLAVVLGLLGKC